MFEKKGNLGAKKLIEEKDGTLFEIYDSDNKTVGFAQQSTPQSQESASAQATAGMDMAGPRFAAGAQKSQSRQSEFKVWLNKALVKDLVPLESQVTTALMNATSSVEAINPKYERVPANSATVISGATVMVTTAQETYLRDKKEDE